MTALIFDCDGVLVDSETLSVTELGITLREAGAPVSDGDIYGRMIGRSIDQIVAMVRDETGVDASALIPDYRARLAQRFQTELLPIPGIGDAIRAMGDLPRAVASSSRPARIQQMLVLTGLRDLFGDHVYSATQVQHGKPAPDLFLMAADRLGVAPTDCIVIEDSPAGLRAAKAAGMRSIGFLGGSHARAAHLAQRLPELAPDLIVADAGELPQAVARLSAQG